MATRKIVFQDPTEGYPSTVISSDDYDAQSRKIVNVLTPASANDAANKSYVDSVANGLDPKNASRLATAAALPACTAAGSQVGKTLTGNANGALTVDGVAVVNGDRVLVKDQVAGADNGIYTQTQLGTGGAPFILTRATDADVNAEVTQGMMTFVVLGTQNQKTGWALLTADPITLDTTALVFGQVAAATSYTFDQGLLLSGASVTLELDTGANAQGAGSSGGSSGLEFDAGTAAGKARVAVNATGGLQRTASGVGALLNGTTLASAAGGLSVDHAPKTQATMTASGAIAKGDGVYPSGNNVVSTGDCTNAAKAHIIGVAAAAISGAGSGEVVTGGLVTGVLTAATAGTAYYLGSTGQPVVFGSLAGGSRIIKLGFAFNTTDLWVAVEDLGSM